MASETPASPSSAKKLKQSVTSSFSSLSISSASTVASAFKAKPLSVADKFHKSAAAKGHRNLLFRAIVTTCSALLTTCCLAYAIDIPHRSLYLVCQIVSAGSLYVQWQTGRPSMFIVRGSSSFVAAIVNLHLTACGRRWPGEDCNDEAWSDFRRVFRIIHIFSSIQRILNGLSLYAQYRYPHRMFRGHGNEQLFARGCVHLLAVPINLLQGILKLSLLPGTKYERLPVEVAANFVTALVLFPCSATTLFNQWYLTKKGFTGNAVSDAWERLLDPDIDCPEQRIRVTIVSASNLRRADWWSDSDPYCVCEVLGRPESTWRTKHIDDTLEPVWNEVQELVEYREHDDIKFTIFDHDEPLKCRKCCKCCERADDLLGTVTLPSEQFHPNGFSGKLELQKDGKKEGERATLTIKVEHLGPKGQSRSKDDAASQDDPPTAVEDIVVKMNVPVAPGEKLTAESELSAGSAQPKLSEGKNFGKKQHTRCHGQACHEQVPSANCLCWLSCIGKPTSPLI